MSDQVLPLEQVDPELGQMFTDICQGRLHAAVLNTRVFPTTGPGPERSLRDRILMGQEVTIVAGRNDPCPCGSGKKFKKCCGRVGA